MMPNVSGLDLERFVAICAGAGEDLAGVADMYLTYTSEQLDALRAAIEQGRVADVEQIAHRCIGSSGTCGMGPLVAPLAALERGARDGHLRDALVLEREARAAFEEIELALRALVDRHSKRP